MIFPTNISGLTMGLALFSTIGASAEGLSNQAAAGGFGTAVTPLAMQLFCAHNPDECRNGEGGLVTMSPDLATMLNRVNARVNGAIRPQADANDVWRLNPSSGDCEDYVLSKRSALIRTGVPSGALRIAYTHTRRGVPHMVLVVRTSDGDYVLDNLSNRVKTLRASGYVVRSMSSANPLRWVAQ